MIQREFQLEEWTWIIQKSTMIPPSSIAFFYTSHKFCKEVFDWLPISEGMFASAPFHRQSLSFFWASLAGIGMVSSKHGHSFSIGRVSLCFQIGRLAPRLPAGTFMAVMIRPEHTGSFQTFFRQNFMASYNEYGLMDAAWHPGSALFRAAIEVPC